MSLIVIFGGILSGCVPKSTSETIRTPLQVDNDGTVLLQQIDIVTSTRDPWGMNTRRTQSWLVSFDPRNNLETFRMIGAPGDFGGTGAANNALPAALISGGNVAAARLYRVPGGDNIHVNAENLSHADSGSSSEAGANAEAPSNFNQNQGQSQGQSQEQKQHQGQEQHNKQESQKKHR